MSLVVAGLDGGGSGSRIVLMDERREVVARAEGGPALAAPGREAAVADVVEGLARGALASVGDDPSLAALWAGLAGAGRPDVRDALERALRGSGVAPVVGVGTDQEAAFRDAFDDGPGILLVAGTGSGVLARAEDGRWIRVGGWGALLGDEGSAWRLGLGALRTALRVRDGRDPEGSLERAVTEACGVEDPEELVAWAEGASKAEVAGLAPVVVALADEGDVGAAALLSEAVEDLREQLLSALTCGAPWSRAPEVALVGGLADEDGPLRRRMESVVRGLGGRVFRGRPDGARGAALRALALLREGPGGGR